MGGSTRAASPQHAVVVQRVRVTIKGELHGHRQSYLDHLLSWTRSVSEKNKIGFLPKFQGVCPIVSGILGVMPAADGSLCLVETFPTVC